MKMRKTLFQHIYRSLSMFLTALLMLTLPAFASAEMAAGSASGVLYFSGVFGTSCQARYSLTGNTLTINADGDKLVFRKR